MTIERVGALDPVGKETPTRKNSEISQAEGAARDAIDLSPESRVKGEFEFAKDAVNKVDDIRADVVARAKEKINDPAYLNDPKIIDTVADRITDLLIG